MRLSKLIIVLLAFAFVACPSLVAQGQSVAAGNPASPFFRLPPGDGPPPGVAPVCDPVTESNCFCDPEFDGSVLACYEPAYTPPPDPHPSCSVAVYYRPIAYVGYPLNVNHAWWFTTDAYYDPWVLDAFPSNSCISGNCGYLNAYETYGVAGQGADNFASGTFYWSYPATGKNVSACKMSFNLQRYTQAWPENSLLYHILGPNSNTFASRAGYAAGIPVPAPPAGVAPGWGQ
jgi:hypothetical protein